VDNPKQKANIHIPSFTKYLFKLEKKLNELKSKYSKIALYGYGGTTRLIAPYLASNLTVIIDKNPTQIQSDYTICSPNEINNFEYDCLIVTLLGRENPIIDELLEKNIPFNKILTLSESFFDEEELFSESFKNDDLEAGICTQEQLYSKKYQEWIEFFKIDLNQKHRKYWEFAFVAESLKKRDMLNEGKKGLGFAVGTEPLASAFCSFGAQIVATDLNFEKASEKGWVNTNQHANNLRELNKKNLCENEKFNRLCTFQNVDMNHIPENLTDFDFIWSACALEHVGSIKLGEEFIYNSLKCLKPGGIAVHTTEYNYSSNTHTIEEGPTVLFRKKDIERIVKNLEKDGHKVIKINYDGGTLPLDKYIDFPPYSQEKHLKLFFSSYIITSIGLIIEKKI